MIGNYYYGTGRRKSAVARVFLKKGTGSIVVNDKPADEFFSRDTGRMVIRQPLKLTNHEATFDIMINVEGGGESGQAGAVRHGITRALIDYDAQLKPSLSNQISRKPTSRTFGNARPGSIFAVWHGSAVPSGATVRNMLPQPLTHFFGVPS